MKPHLCRLPRGSRATAKHPTSCVFALLLCAPLAAQQLDIKPPPTPDPVKGWHDMSPMTEAERAMLREQRAPHDPIAHELGAASAAGAMYGAGQTRRDQVSFDAIEDHIWAAGSTYKASFGKDGFVYVPFLGSDAPQDYPVHFVLHAVRVGGVELPLAAAEPVQTDSSVRFDRGAVREQYDLTLEQIEQTFVVDSKLAGDVDVELRVVTELAAAAADGMQFRNALGAVHYGEAQVVAGAQRHAVATTLDGNTIRIHVPAAERGEGALVIDPIIYTSAISSTFSTNSGQPDIAYDATADQYLAVWHVAFSAADYDVWSEFRYSDSTPVPGSLATIDYTTYSHQNPRVADLHALDRFLVVSQHFESGRWSIFGRFRLINSLPHPIVFRIDDPTFIGDCVNPSIGGDSGLTGGQFLVAWQRNYAANDTDIHARIVNGDTSIPGSTLLIENSGSTMYTLPQVSRSNGGGFTASPRWMIVYQFAFSSADTDIYGAAVVGSSSGGYIATPNAPIDTSSNNDQVPMVTSPATDFGGSAPMFMVTYERQSPYDAMARLVTPLTVGQFLNQIPLTDLSTTFGLPGFWVRPECDGDRFAVLTGGVTIGVATLAYNGSQLVMQEGFQPLPGIPSYPRIASKHSGGGSHTDYGIAWVDSSVVPDRIGISAYGGYAPGSDVTRRLMACQGLHIDAAGHPFLGESLTFSLTNFGVDIPGFLFGATAPATNLVCPACPLGLDIYTPIQLIVGTQLVVSIPPNASLVGVAASVQGFGLGSGPCIANLHFSDTIDFQVR